MYSNLQQREIFHLSFLRQFAKRIKTNTYSIKGGSNLRFFFKSIRYSEDMDIDIRNIETHKLKEIVMDILMSKTLEISLKAFQIDKIVPPNVETAKQTETVQRFKIHLITFSREDLFTKIEFSKRKLGDQIEHNSVDAQILYKYKQTPLIIPHYPIDIAIKQKINALIGRATPQVRDIFDIFILHSQLHYGDLNKIVKSYADEKLQLAETIILNTDYNSFKNTVCCYLQEEDRKYYENSSIWEEIQIKVAEIIAEGKINGAK